MNLSFRPSWSSSKKKKDDDDSEGEEQKEEKTTLSDTLADKGSTTLKLTKLLEQTKEKFKDKYGKLNLVITVPALLQLMEQLKAQKTGDDVFVRDTLYEKAGKIPSSQDLEALKEPLNYATWAYDTTDSIKENLQNSGFILLKHVPNEVAGTVGYYIAWNGETKTALIGVQGTSSVDDIITDCCAATSTHKLDRSFVTKEVEDPIPSFFKKMIANASNEDSPLTHMHCHEGILISAKWLAKQLEPFMKDFFIPLGYNIQICGHSLGAGASALVACLLRSQFPTLTEGASKIKVYAFASPPVLNKEAAIASSSFVTTIVNNSDVIPRCSLNNLEVMLECLSKIQEELKERGMDCSNFQSSKAYFAKMHESKKDGTAIMTPEEALEILIKAQEMVSNDEPENLYVPGKVILMYDKWQDRKRRHDLKEEEGQDEGRSERAEDEDNEKLPIYCVETNPITTTLCSIEIHKDLVIDHLTDSYHRRLDALLKKD